MAQEQANALTKTLLNKGVDIETIAKVMEITVKRVERILGGKSSL